MILAAIPVGLMDAGYGIAIWYWVSLFQPHTQSFGFAKSFPFGPIAGVVAILTWLIWTKPKLPPANAIVVLIISLGVWTGFTTLNAVYPKQAYGEWDVFIKTIIMVVIGISIAQTKRRLDLLVWAICLALGYYGFKLGLFALQGGKGDNYRGPSYMQANNELARGMMMTIPLLIYLFLTNTKTWVRLGIAGVGLSSFACLVLSGSRGAWLATIAMIAFAGLRLKRGVLILTIAAIGGFVMFQVLPERITARFNTIDDYETDASFQGRVGAWMYAFDSFTRRPLAGGGFLIFDLEYNKASHNSYVQVLGEHGGVGFILFLSLLIACGMATRSVIRQARDRADLAWAKTLAYLIQIILVGYLVGSITKNHAFFPLLYAIIGVLASLQIIVRKEVRAGTEQQLAPPQSSIAPGVGAANPGGRF